MATLLKAIWPHFVSLTPPPQLLQVTQLTSEFCLWLSNIHCICGTYWYPQIDHRLKSKRLKSWNWVLIHTVNVLSLYSLVAARACRIVSLFRKEGIKTAMVGFVLHHQKLWVMIEMHPCVLSVNTGIVEMNVNQLHCHEKATFHI